MPKTTPIIDNKHYNEKSIFSPESLLRESRRQKGITEAHIPEICVLDPDGDLLQYMYKNGTADKNPSWACYHSILYDISLDSLHFGVIPYVVGGPYAVLIAEELFVSGCRFLISITSAGKISGEKPPPYFILIDQALRDEGTSYHYLPPSEYAPIDRRLLGRIKSKVNLSEPDIVIGKTWTTDAPFRETQSSIDHARKKGILAVEMEAAALYAFSAFRQKPVICFAHVTNQMGSISNDFEKGENQGSTDCLKLIRKLLSYLYTLNLDLHSPL